MFSLRVAYNTECPVNRVPVEVLAGIFVRNLPFENEYFGRDYIQIPDSTHILALTQVCSFWRQVALGTPALCSVLSVSGMPELALTQASRLSTQPLRVFCSGWPPANYAGSSTVLSQVISENPDPPAMKSMSIDVPYIANSEQEQLAMMNTRLLELRTPMLEHLRLSNISLPVLWASQLIRSANLRLLSILLTDPVDITQAPSLTDIVGVLGTLTSLENLSMDGWLAPSSPPALLPKKATMPRLRELNLSGFPKGCINILGNLDFARPLSLLLVYIFLDHDDDDLHAEEILRILESHGELPPEVASNICGDDGYVEVAYGRLLPRGQYSYRRPITLVFPGDIETSRTETVLPVLPRSNTTALALDGTCPIDWGWHHNLREVLRQWSTLREVCVTHTEIAVSEAHGDEDVMDELLERPWFEICRDEVEMRSQVKAEDGSPVLRSLTFRQCDEIPSEVLDALREAVPRMRVTNEQASAA
ncbi:hypothetical protein PUNSTDRAFT_137999 [Punctularia strigosozonata HHB-11173 SS5]|uniref:F-box domain-containing protein n=1 Tax=Punctularia strigosozonata (strain HHB-11173) TaxID=741275 RepID=R7S340_PUNST|nr:uncharacterized protein PUNSTDRAFT_137999 [Punctularia strigosozonata HHB-11173 SS5]EIN04800.1 hypothetical protein PUNSTDRAFT_137999 [Punctularia strigosozonata HHB-11173 SS5]